MKKIILFLFVCFALNSFSQAKKEIKITKKQLADSKTLSDLISDIPKDCKIKTYFFSANINGSLKEFTCVSEGIIPELKALLLYKEKGQSVFIENIKSDCQKSHQTSYKLTLEE